MNTVSIVITPNATIRRDAEGAYSPSRGIAAVQYKQVAHRSCEVMLGSHLKALAFRPLGASLEATGAADPETIPGSPIADQSEGPARCPASATRPKMAMAQIDSV